MATTWQAKVCCCGVLDTFSRKIVGWSSDNCQDSTLVVGAWTWRSRISNYLPATLCVPIVEREFTSSAFNNKIRSAGLMPSFGTIGGV